MKLEHLALAGVGLYILAANRAPGTGGIPTTSIPSVSPPPPSAKTYYVPPVGTAKEQHTWAKQKAAELSAWYRTQRKAWYPLTKQIWSVENKIAYIRGYPGDTAPQALASLGPLLAQLKARLSTIQEPISKEYRARQQEILQYW